MQTQQWVLFLADLRAPTTSRGHNEQGVRCSGDSTRLNIGVVPFALGRHEMSSLYQNSITAVKYRKKNSVSTTALNILFCSILRLHRSSKVSIGLDEASCPEAGRSRPGYTSALIAQRGSSPANKTTAQKLLST